MDSAAAGLPVRIDEGWPVAVGFVWATEAGTLLGEFLLDGLRSVLAESPEAVALRIDANIEREQWMIRHPDGTVEPGHVVDPPLDPTPIPRAALASDKALENWVQHTYGSTGRLIIAADRWWVVNDSALELSLVSGSTDVVLRINGGEELDDLPFAWLENPSAGRSIADRYGLTIENGTP